MVCLLSEAFRRPCVTCLVGLLCLLTIAAAHAEDMEARGSVRGEGLVNTDEGAVVLDGRIDFEVDIGSFTFGGAYRAYDFGGDYNPAGIAPVYDLKHRYFEARHSGLFAKAGHYFSTLGRGLTLRSFEDIDLERDTALDGFTAEYEAGRYMITALAGELSEDVTDIQDREHRVRGGRFQASFTDMITVAATGLDRNTVRHDEEVALPESLSTFDDEVLGAEVEIWTGFLTFAGEYARREGGYYPLLRQRDSDGHGAYLSASVSTERLSLLGEYKDYERFEHELSSPPICVKEHVWALMNRVTHEVDFNNERGFLIEGILSAPADLQVTGGASEARTQGGGLVHWEIFGQVDQIEPRWGIRSLAGSWSREYLSGRFTEYVSLALETEYQVAAGRIVEIGLEAQATEQPSGKSHEDLMAAINFYPAPGVTLAALGETTTSDDEARDIWLSGEIRMEVTQDFEVALGGGTERGGKRCSGGVCYTAPEYAGVRLTFSTFF
jgi:hypothetical protein